MSINSESSEACPCTEDTSSTDSPLSVNCLCPRDEHEIVIHEDTCLLYKNETIYFPHEPKECECVTPQFENGVCKCCSCLEDQCRCRKAGREVFDEWRNHREIAAMPAVLESSHPLMQRFQETLKQFLIKENAIAEEEILNLKDELRLKKESYEKDLEAIYRTDHDTNAQRVLIEEYESTLAQRAAERQAAEVKARESNEAYKKAQEKLGQDIITEKETKEELEALTNLCRQLEEWREETESDLAISQRMSDKMRAEKKALADEKRQLDMMIFGLSNEVWKLESKLELFKKQYEIKNTEMEKINDKVTSYAAELEDLDLDKRRLVSLWNSVLVNIQQRDKVYDSVREDYRALQENYRTLISNLEITKKISMEEMNKGKELAMNKDKLAYDINGANKQFDTEDAKRINLETKINELTESIEMTERDQNMIKMENQAMNNILKSTEKDLDRKNDQKLKLENEILSNLQECLLNDKAVESMANGIKKMRDMSRKQEISLVSMENQHAKMMLDIEVHRNRQVRNKQILEENLENVRLREKELDALQEKRDQKSLTLTRKQRELDIIIKKHTTLKEIFDMKSPQERRIEELEMQIKALRERAESMQHEWLRLQGHVVKIAAQHQKIQADISLISKQIQICDQKSMRIQAECDHVAQERLKVDRSLRALRGQLEVLERTRKDAKEKNAQSQHDSTTRALDCTANLKDAEDEILQIEDDIEEMDKEKMNLNQDLDRVQREALIWQRKGILAVELKRNIHNAKSAAGEIGQMRNEIHRMEVRREQLRRTSEKLAEDLAQCISRREIAVEKNRAAAAVERGNAGAGGTAQAAYRHKLRLAKADHARATKELAEAKGQMQHLETEQRRLESEIKATQELNSQLEERVASLLHDCREQDKQKQWLLERVVRSQRLGSELATAVKRQSLKVRKPKNTVLGEYQQARDLNAKMKYIVDTIYGEYPYISDRLDSITHTLNIESPSESPRLLDESCLCIQEVDENVAEKPLCQCVD